MSGMAPVAHVLFNKFMTFNPKNPDFINRDRFVLSWVPPCPIHPSQEMKAPYIYNPDSVRHLWDHKIRIRRRTGWRSQRHNGLRFQMYVLTYFSNGHGCMLQYALLHLFGYGVSMDDLKHFRVCPFPESLIVWSWPATASWQHYPRPPRSSRHAWHWGYDWSSGSRFQ